MGINKLLKIVFVLSTVAFLVTIVSVPKTNCDACNIEYEERTIDGKEAFIIFKDACIDYKNSWETYRDGESLFSNSSA